MSNDHSIKKKPERDRIDLHKSDELKDWIARFGVDGGKIKEAVARVGPMVVDVKRYLGK